jgi:hypothetical protein
VNGNRPAGEPESKPDVAMVEQAARIIAERGAAIELRALHVKQRYGGPKTIAGFFDYDHLDLLAQEAARLSPEAVGVYITLNPLSPDLLARRCNRVDVADGGDLAGDQHVLRRKWILIDADPSRITGISSTEAEKAKAWSLVQEMREDLRVDGWADPLVGDSGNGYHLLYRIDLPAADGELIKRTLLTLDQRYSTAGVKIDTKVFNPARISKLYGTLSRKGDHTPDRPHRLAKLLEVPEWAS